jgi:hypothetical protein
MIRSFQEVKLTMPAQHFGASESLVIFRTSVSGIGKRFGARTSAECPRVHSRMTLNESFDSVFWLE